VAHTRSAKKRIRQSERHAGLNRQQRSALRTVLRKVRGAATQGEARAAFQAAERLLDRAARKHLIHRNTAARQKSRLQKLIRSKP
jgi:small subunit ribosomal protein S20